MENGSFVKGYSRDGHSSALVNTDNQAYESYKKMREKSIKFNALESEMSSVRNELNELKQFLSKLVSRN